jgi:Holliday junction resolvasome RuvABC endonuclease subunit
MRQLLDSLAVQAARLAEIYEGKQAADRVKEEFQEKAARVSRGEMTPDQVMHDVSSLLKTEQTVLPGKVDARVAIANTCASIRKLQSRERRPKKKRPS